MGIYNQLNFPLIDGLDTFLNKTGPYESLKDFGPITLYVQARTLG